MSKCTPDTAGSLHRHSVGAPIQARILPETSGAWLPSKKRRMCGVGDATKAILRTNSREPQLTQAQRAVVDLALKGKINIFVTGSAGTGKSVVLRTVYQEWPKSTVALTAPTGTAALLLGGQTIHSWAGIGQAGGSIDALVHKVRRDAVACHRWVSTTLLIVDEVSMVSGHLLDTLDVVGRAVRGKQKPFGGLQLLLCGDFHQLPPPNNESSGWAFEARCWAEAIDLSIELTEVLRLEDREAPFATALEEVRSGVVSDTSWALLRGLAAKQKQPAAVALVPTNRQAEKINGVAMQKLLEETVSQSLECASEHVTAGSAFAFKAFHVSLPSAAEPAHRAPLVPAELRLCEHAIIVLTQSQRVGPTGETFLPNGTRCKVTGFARLPRRLFDHRHPEFDPGAQALGAAERQFLLRHDGILPKVEVLESCPRSRQDGFLLYPSVLSQEGAQTGLVQLPARLGWALTMHRAQGASLGATVVHLDGLFSPGQAYVALSRCRRERDLWIESLPKRDLDGRVRAFEPDPKVKAFYGTLRAEGG